MTVPIFEVLTEILWAYVYTPVSMLDIYEESNYIM